jgi:hypothetical protein
VRFGIKETRNVWEFHFRVLEEVVANPLDKDIRKRLNISLQLGRGKKVGEVVERARKAREAYEALRRKRHLEVL